jgi:hypothetical protein
MKWRILFFLALINLMFALARRQLAFAAKVPPQEGVDVTNPEAGGEDLRIETRHGPVHIWRPANYDSHTAGIVIYIHGYLTSIDQTWANDRLAMQFHDSGRNALFIAIEAPQSINEQVSWTSLADLLRTVEDRAPYPLPRGPLVVVGHSAAYRTILMWLNDPRIQYLILLDAMYTGEGAFRVWLHPHPHAKPHQMVLVANDTRLQSNQFARHIFGTARRKIIPERASSFTPRETKSRLLYLRSQYDHYEIINNGIVIPVLLQISPLKPLPTPKPHPARRIVQKSPDAVI